MDNRGEYKEPSKIISTLVFKLVASSFEILPVFPPISILEIEIREDLGNSVAFIAVPFSREL